MRRFQELINQRSVTQIQMQFTLIGYSTTPPSCEKNNKFNALIFCRELNYCSNRVKCRRFE